MVIVLESIGPLATKKDVRNTWGIVLRSDSDG